ncbi:DUF169 domain-containing protein [Raoultibacter phocaeensis]|uniref:DUF169 domain-containing protein n=1 Tax=Raoultibacter phocaeensis TaxID=2479841 RepID=UPI0011198933|nr:DUF169 domain-containing protein [Raoultibacter phocaeensis]
MKSKIVDRFDFRIQPIGISFSDKKPDDAIEFPPDKRVCVVSMLLAASKGKTVAVSDETCACPGGAVGICRGDAFTRRNHKTAELLSTGIECDDPNELPKHVQYGERFFKSPEVVQRWKDALPYADAQTEYAVFRPLADFSDDEPPAIALLFANPDQLSALVIMSGYSRGSGLNVSAPFAAACQSILFAYDEIGSDEPKAILGGFDISQRHRLPKELLTLTMPFQLYREIEEGIDEGCITTEAWKRIEDRWSD